MGFNLLKFILFYNVLESIEKDYAVSYFSDSFDASYDNMYIYYSEDSLNKIKKLSNDEFLLKLENMHQMCSNG